MDLQAEFLNRFLENLAQFLGDNCEIVVHDFTSGYDSTVVKILNGHVSGREVGACPTNLFFEVYKTDDTEKTDIPIYFNNGSRGQVLKSCTTFIRNEKGVVTGAVCINFDISNLLFSQSVIQNFIGYETNLGKENTGENEVYYKSVNELLDDYLKMVERDFGKPATMMTKTEKMDALAFLDNRGVLQISKSSIRLCRYFGISKFTLYTYLEEIHKKVETAKIEKKTEA